MGDTDKRRRKPRPMGRVPGNISRIIDELEDIELGMEQMLQDFEVIRRVWELRFEGHGPTEIERKLSISEPWARRTRRQIEEILRPADLRVADLRRERTRKSRGEADETAEFKPVAADYGSRKCGANPAESGIHTIN